MGDITLTFSGGRTGLTQEALEQRLQAAAPLLAEVLAGEAQHRDNQGWFSVDEAAGPERVDFLLEQAARVRADAAALGVRGLGGAPPAAPARSAVNSNHKRGPAKFSFSRGHHQAACSAFHRVQKSSSQNLS